MSPLRIGQFVLHILLPYMQAVALVDLPQHSGGYTGSDTVGWDVPCHHRACGDDAARSDGHATTHRRTGAQPTVIPDGDGFGILQRMAAVGDTPLVPRKRRLAALIAATRCAGEKRDTLSCHARRCTASSMAQGLKHYA